MTRGARRLTLLGALLLGSVALATVDDGMRYYSNKDYASAAREFMTAALEGNSNGQFWLGYLYDMGQGVNQDYVQAASWYRKAADQGYAVAQDTLGTLYKNGQGVNQDYAQAASWYRKAADQGYAMAQKNLGILYKNGQGVNQDYAQAVSWYRKAADQGHAVAQNSLGILYGNGQGVNQDYAQAVYWFRKAADQGDKFAQNNLGNSYFEGEGVNQDYAQAAYWYRKAADQGFHPSQSSLGELYENGLGVERNIQTALVWYQKAAAQGSGEAGAAIARLTAAAAQPAPLPLPRPTPTTATTPLLDAKKRVALLIGNQAYPSSRLNNPINDVTKLSATLKSLSFTVTVTTDLNRRDLLSTVRTFLNTIDRNTVSFLYYSGHGMEVAGRNYLIPIDFDAATPEEIDDQGVDIQKLYDGLPSKAAGSDNFLVLDACRNNPLAVTRSLSDTGGVKAVAMRAPFIDTNLVVAYAASSGQKASDGVGNSPYVTALNTALLTPNISWTTAFGSVSKTLRASSQGQQVPTYLSQGDLEFVFNRR